MQNLQRIVARKMNDGAHFEDIIEFLVAVHGLRYDVAEDIVYDVEGQLTIEEETSYYNDSMDGDHESALASAGFGTDEDYGYFGDYE